MPMDVLKAQDAILGGKARFARFYEDFVDRWHEPEVKATLRVLWQGLPSEQRERLRAHKPAAFDEIERRLGRKDGVK